MFFSHLLDIEKCPSFRAGCFTKKHPKSPKLPKQHLQQNLNLFTSCGSSNRHRSWHVCAIDRVKRRRRRRATLQQMLGNSLRFLLGLPLPWLSVDMGWCGNPQRKNKKNQNQKIEWFETKGPGHSNNSDQAFAEESSGIAISPLGWDGGQMPCGRNHLVQRGNK